MIGPNAYAHSGSGGQTSLSPHHGMLRPRPPPPSAPGRSFQHAGRSFPVSRQQPNRLQHSNPQRVPPQLPPSATATTSGNSGSGKQIFGPNSAVTISVANKKRMESQQRQMAASAHARSREEHLKNTEKESKLFGIQLDK